LADALGESQAALSAEVEQHCEYVTETTTAALRTAVALSSAEHRIAENEAGWADARALAARMQEAAEKRQQAVENMAARLAALERQHAASQERDDWKRIVDQNLAASDETVATMARELGAAREERDVFLGGLQSAQALIVTWATWLRATFPKELEVGDEEQAMLDYAAALAAEGETPA
jgi:chromosome segregation ATPase